MSPYSYPFLGFISWHNVTLNNETIFFIMWPWILMIINHDWQRLTMVDFQICDNLSHNEMLDHSWPWLTMINHAWPWLIFTLRQSLWKCDVRPWLIFILTMIDHDWFSYWDNLCHNVTFNQVDHEWPWLTMVDDGWALLIFILGQSLPQCDVGPWLTMVINPRKLY